jgi:hypothetical protein
MLGCKNFDSLKLEVKYCPPPPYNPDDWKLSVYPNPAKGRFIVEIIGGHPELEVSLQDVFGRILRKFTIEAASGSSAAWLEMPGMAAGSYIITVSSEKRSEVQKILLHSR